MEQGSVTLTQGSSRQAARLATSLWNRSNARRIGDSRFVAPQERLQPPPSPWDMTRKNDRPSHMIPQEPERIRGLDRRMRLASASSDRLPSLVNTPVTCAGPVSASAESVTV